MVGRCLATGKGGIRDAASEVTLPNQDVEEPPHVPNEGEILERAGNVSQEGQGEMGSGIRR